MSTTNPLKRAHSPTHAPRSHRLRAKLSPSAFQLSDSSATSTHSVSEDSALFSTDRASASESTSSATVASDAESSDLSDSTDSDSESDSGSGSEESDGSESDSEESKDEDEVGMGLLAQARGVEDEFEGVEDADGVVRLAPRKRKPVIQATGMKRGGDLRARLQSFLPMLAAANEELEVERKEGTLEGRMLDLGAEEAEGEYIEMDLGLGVLEERDPDASDTGSESESESDGGEDEKDILGKLMGQERRVEGVGIQVVDDL